MGRWRKNGRFAAVTWVMVTAVLLPHAAAWLGLNPAEISHNHHHIYYGAAEPNHHAHERRAGHDGHPHHAHTHPHTHESEPCPDRELPLVSMITDTTVGGLGLLFLPPPATALPGLGAAHDWWGDETAVDPIFLPPPKTPPRQQPPFGI